MIGFGERRQGTRVSEHAGRIGAHGAMDQVTERDGPGIGDLTALIEECHAWMRGARERRRARVAESSVRCAR